MTLRLKLMDIKMIIVGELETNCYLLSDRHEMAIIDPGGSLEAIERAITEIKKKQDVYLKFIVLTHYHEDHTGIVAELKEEYGGQTLIHKQEKDWLDINVDKLITGNELINVGDYELEVLHTPGHSAGSICLLGKNIIFTGDTIFADGYGRTDLAGGSEKDMANSLALLRKIIKPGMKVYPGHGETFIA